MARPWQSMFLNSTWVCWTDLSSRDGHKFICHPVVSYDPHLVRPLSLLSDLTPMGYIPASEPTLTVFEPSGIYKTSWSIELLDLWPIPSALARQDITPLSPTIPIRPFKAHRGAHIGVRDSPSWADLSSIHICHIEQVVGTGLISEQSTRLWQIRRILRCHGMPTVLGC